MFSLSLLTNINVPQLPSLGIKRANRYYLLLLFRLSFPPRCLRLSSPISRINLLLPFYLGHDSHMTTMNRESGEKDGTLAIIAVEFHTNSQRVMTPLLSSAVIGFP